MQRDRDFVPDRRMRLILIVVSTPILHLLAGVRKRQEQMRVQTFRPELAVEGFDEAIIGRLSGPRKAERVAISIGSQVKITEDEFAAIVHPVRLRIANQAANPFQGLHHIPAAIDKAWISRRTEP